MQGMRIEEVPSNEAKARLFKTARLAPATINHILLSQEIAQSTARDKYDWQSLSEKCFSVEFQSMRQNTYTQRMEPVFNLREADGTFFGYYYESALHLCL